MARYIDADNFRKTMIKRFGCIPCLTDYSEASRNDIPIDDALNLAPTADVVPKREVDYWKQQAFHACMNNGCLDPKIITHFENAVGHDDPTGEEGADRLETAISYVKAEVGKLQNELVIWKQNRFNLFQRLECYETARQKVAREIFEEIFDRLITSFPTSSFIDAPCTTENRLYSMIAELKKKYQVETK